ncbi:helix-turn-helix transcriptional regulator [bacterium]|nr:MAG: helix-turn-helix transcriptional regulator [bacterium]
MTNTAKLRDAINRTGISITFVANSLGITREGLYNKLNGETEFKGSEIAAMAKLLNLSTKERDEIFFAS